MPIVFAAAANHAPGITGRRDNASPEQREVFFAAYAELRARLERARLDALIVVTAEHWTNFFLSNMPAFCVGLGEAHVGPVEDEPFLKIPQTRVPGAPVLARSVVDALGEAFDVAFSEELKLDHGVMVPLHLLVPSMAMPVVPIIINCLAQPMPRLGRCWQLGQALRAACAARPERIGLVCAGGLSHWPATPRSGKLNVEWDRAIVDAVLAHDRQQLCAISDEEIVREAGPGGHEIRAWAVLAGASDGEDGEVLCFEPIPAYAVTGAVVDMRIGGTPPAAGAADRLRDGYLRT